MRTFGNALILMSVGVGLCAGAEMQGQNPTGAEGSPGERIQDFDLSCAQVAKLAAIREEYGRRIEDAAGQVSALLREETKRVRAVLTPEQKVKLEGMREERKEWRAEGFAERVANLRELRLTDAEMTKIAQIRQEFRPRITQGLGRLKGILTPEQMQTREKALSAGQSRREVIESLNLTDDQKAKVEAVGKEVRNLVREEIERMRGVLSAEQQEKLADIKNERQDRIRDRFAAAVANSEDLNLTDQQKSQIEAVRMEFRPRIHEAGNQLRAVVRAELDAIVNVLREGGSTARGEARARSTPLGETLTCCGEVGERATPCSEVYESGGYAR